jgi:voltage-gated potassium channel
MVSEQEGTSMSTTEAPAQPAQIKDLALRGRKRLAIVAVVRTGLTIALVVAIYFLLPFDHGSNAGAVAELALGVLALVAIIVWQIRRIVGSDHPISRAVEALALSVPLYVLLFATTYFLMARANQTSFGGPLSRTDAMYFSSTIFTTVGFGDITAKSEAARLMVTLQMWLDLVFLGLVVRLVVNAVKFSQQRRAS